jgi:hypothetical protein
MFTTQQRLIGEREPGRGCDELTRQVVNGNAQPGAAVAGLASDGQHPPNGAGTQRLPAVLAAHRVRELAGPVVVRAEEQHLAERISAVLSDRELKDARSGAATLVLEELVNGLDPGGGRGFVWLRSHDVAPLHQDQPDGSRNGAPDDNHERCRQHRDVAAEAGEDADQCTRHPRDGFGCQLYGERRDYEEQ